jgi:hypothetical protein
LVLRDRADRTRAEAPNELRLRGASARARTEPGKMAPEAVAGRRLRAREDGAASGRSGEELRRAPPRARGRSQDQGEQAPGAAGASARARTEPGGATRPHEGSWRLHTREDGAADQSSVC